MFCIIYSRPGKGKSLLLSHIQKLKKCEEGFSDFIKCKRELKTLNNTGASFKMPPQRHLCFSDYSHTYRKIKSYYLDGFRLALPNPYFETALIPPYSNIFLDEAQRYYDSRMSIFLREEVYRFYQMHRHNHYNIFMTCQRLANIDVNIRSLADYYLYIKESKLKTNEFGQIIGFKIKLKVFTSLDVAEAYQTAEEKGESKKWGKDFVVEDNYDIGRTYDTHNCKPAFYNMAYGYRDFDYYTENGYEFSLNGFIEFNNTHYFVAPKGYYKNKKQDEAILQKGGLYGYA